MAENSILATALADEAVKDRFKTALRRRVGVGRPWSVTSLAAESGVAERDLRSYQDQSGCMPTLSKFFKLGIALGPDFVNEVMSVAGFEGLRAVAAHDSNPFAAQMALADAMFRVAGWLADGKFDHSEKREAIPVMLATIAQLSAFVAGLQAGQEA